MHSSDKTSEEQRQTLIRILEECHTGFMVTEISGSLHGRPMSNAGIEGDLKALWFVTQRDSEKVAEIAADQRVLLGYTNSSCSEWASINGTAALVDDKAKVKQLWNAFMKSYFTGPDDPNILLIRVTPTEAEYWDTDSRAVAMLKFAWSKMTGKHFDEGENARLRL